MYPGQQGYASETENREEAPNYGHRLTGDVAAPKDRDGTGVAVGRAPTEPTSSVWQQLRQSPRIRCSGSVELRFEGDDTCMWGTLTDISLHGCYVELANTFPVDTKVYLVLKSLGVRVQTAGTVRTSYPSKGMGIAYAEMEPGQLQQLKQLLDALTGGGIVPKKIAVRENDSKEFIDPIAFRDEMTEFFRKNLLLSREEFHKIADRVRRS
jgi:hypothetical protein